MWLLEQVAEAVHILMVAGVAFWVGLIIITLLLIGIAKVKQ